MPARYFAPKDGFADNRVAAVKVDTIDGYATSAQVLADGTERPTDSGTNHHRQSIPLWTEQELERLVAGGSWKEVDAPAAPQTADKVAESAPDAPHDEPQPVEDPNA